jgi:hypothetical protein
MESKEPFWVFAAIRPDRYQEFLQAHRAGKIDLQAFAPWGELIISGEGKSPPRSVIDKVATMYQTDPERFAKNVETDVVRAAEEYDKANDQEDSPSQAESPDDLLARSSWEEFLQLPDKKVDSLLTRRRKHFSQPGFEKDLIRTAEYLKRFEEPIEAAQALMTVVNRLKSENMGVAEAFVPLHDAPEFRRLFLVN